MTDNEKLAVCRAVIQWCLAGWGPRIGWPDGFLPRDVVNALEKALVETA